MSEGFQLDAEGKITAATSFLMIHHALRRDAVRFPHALAALNPHDAEQAQRLAGHWKLYHWALADHSENEDDSLFPLVTSRAGELAPVMAELEKDHADLDRELEEITRQMERLPEAGAIEASRAATERLRAHLDRHLALEEKHIVPVLVDRVRPEEIAGGQGGGPGGGPQGPGGAQDGVGGAYRPPTWLISAWTDEGLDPAVTDAVLAALPPKFQEQMGAALVGWRTDYHRLVAEVWRDVPADLAPEAP
ncbi:hemerythrin domain-containing protein [Streptomyces gibsoniae]|uniref:Hemerythrin domain-containing protein n=1 Tax=Streptomyces gibsoniae TaxID=3075529 RepID=A0ABU2TM25_9ACTN|nr:hemerythrin domain-containing protein [Streptomyces sp. DSM 41699]MDT0461967.1 hemerythrin domain-containing protein [Streptomyces sp. DSM 41699]